VQGSCSKYLLEAILIFYSITAKQVDQLAAVPWCGALRAALRNAYLKGEEL
jgi:hypothetical protein